MNLSVAVFMKMCLLLLVSSCFASEPTEDEIAEIKRALNSIFWEHQITMLCSDKNHLRSAVVKYGLEGRFATTKQSFMRKSCYLKIYILIEKSKEVDVLKVYLNPKYELNFNFYFDSDANNRDNTSELYDGRSNSLDAKVYTPLLFAVALNRIVAVKEMVNAELVPKLKLDMSHKNMPLVNARSIARKFYDPAKRQAMLDALRIDPEKHDLTLVNKHLKGELSITVKEAVMADDVEMVESALLLGNFGDKTDVQIIRRAMINENYLILEMLVMEGYAIPAEKDRPAFKKMNKDDVTFILSQSDNDKRRPLPHRYRSWYSYVGYNEHCV